MPHSNTIMQGDCAAILPNLPAGCAHLAYLDPPFMTNRTHASQRSGEHNEFNDRWPDITAYLHFLRARITLIHRALDAHGSILVHCDWRTVHHIRLMLDEIFGPQRFVNHLIWWYGLGGSSPRRFARKHDDILFYAKSEAYYFVPPRVPATSRRMQGQTKKATDVLAIPAINNQAKERVGYPTQKPLALLELLICACAPPDTLVLDPFCGSGTALLAARNLGRQYLGIDINPSAVRLAINRLNAHTKTQGAAKRLGAAALAADISSKINP